MASVIFYHAEFIAFGQKWLAGGFIGVDIFFVISGYLISRIILTELIGSGSFNFAHFYERRARRILPILLVVIITTLPFAWTWLQPTALVEYSQSILSAVFFGSNFFFYTVSTEYGAADALLKPFLHTWSLGIEEQFYLVFPLVLLFAARFLKGHYALLMWGFLIVSLYSATQLVVSNKELNFFSPVSRFWELLAGALLAYLECKKGRPEHGLATQMMPLAGLILVMAPIIFFDDATPHPSLLTLIPVAGVAMIIGFSNGKDPVGALLGTKPFVAIGLISYSAYLWHFPIMAFGRIRNASPDNYDRLEWIGGTIALSVISYFLIEKPFRFKLPRKAFLTSTGLVLVSLLGIFAILGTRTLDYSNLDEIAERRPIVYTDSQAFLEQWYLARELGVVGDFTAQTGHGILVLGNSHATDLYRALKNQNLPGYDLGVIHPPSKKTMFQISCLLPIVTDQSDSCLRYQFSPAEIAKIKSLYAQARTVVIATRFHKYDDEFAALPGLLEDLNSKGKQAILLSNIPEIPHQGAADKFFNPLNRWISTHARLPDEAARVEIEQETYQRYFSNADVIGLNAELERIARSHGVDFIDRSHVLCTPMTKTCDVITDDGKMVSWDYGHLSVGATQYYGAKFLAETDFMSLLEGG